MAFRLFRVSFDILIENPINKQQNKCRCFVLVALCFQIFVKLIIQHENQERNRLEAPRTAIKIPFIVKSMKLTINSQQYRTMRDTFWRRKIVSKLYLCLCFEMRGSWNEIRTRHKTFRNFAFIAFLL